MNNKMEDKDFFNELQKQKSNNVNMNTVEVSTLQNFMKEWEPYNGTCPHCNSTNIEYQTGIMLTSNPPQYRLRCKDCGKHFFSGQIEHKNPNNNSLNEYFKHDQSILNIPKVGDPLPGDSPWMPFTPDPFRLDPPTTKGNYGWICPKCGRVMAPFIDSCKFCGGEENNTLTTPITKTNPNIVDLNDYLNKNASDFNSIVGIINPNNKLTNDSDLLNYITITQSTDNDIKVTNTAEINDIYDGMSKEEMKQKFLNESESVFEAVSKYKEWEKENIK